MATVGKDIADKIRDADGYYSDDPRVMRIVEYTNAWGNLAYGIEYGDEIGRYEESEFVCNPRIYWEAT